MSFLNVFYADVKRISIAHERTVDITHKCEFPNGRGQHGLVYCIKGEGEYRFSTGEKCEMREGEVMLLFPNAAYSISTKSAFAHYTVNFEIHEDSSDFSFFKKNYYLLASQNSEQYRQTLKKLVTLWATKTSGFEMKAKSYVYELLSLLHTDIYMKEYGKGYYARLNPAKEFIESNFGEEMSLESLARLCNMSVTNFRREWTKIYKESPLQYRDRVRIAYAKEYLLCGDYNVCETAEKCGFDDVSYFVRFFKKHTGISPGAFKMAFL